MPDPRCNSSSVTVVLWFVGDHNQLQQCRRQPPATTTKPSCTQVHKQEGIMCTGASRCTQPASAMPSAAAGSRQQRTAQPSCTQVHSHRGSCVQVHAGAHGSAVSLYLCSVCKGLRPANIEYERAQAPQRVWVYLPAHIALAADASTGNLTCLLRHARPPVSAQAAQAQQACWATQCGTQCGVRHCACTHSYLARPATTTKPNQAKPNQKGVFQGQTEHG